MEDLEVTLDLEAMAEATPGLEDMVEVTPAREDMVEDLVAWVVTRALEAMGEVTPAPEDTVANPVVTPGMAVTPDTEVTPALAAMEVIRGVTLALEVVSWLSKTLHCITMLILCDIGLKDKIKGFAEKKLGGHGGGDSGYGGDSGSGNY